MVSEELLTKVETWNVHTNTPKRGSTRGGDLIKALLRVEYCEGLFGCDLLLFASSSRGKISDDREVISTIDMKYSSG